MNDYTPEQTELQRKFNDATNKPTLFAIVDQLRAVFARVDENEGEIDDATDADLERLGLTLEQKAEGYAMFYRTLKAEAEAIQKVADHYAGRARSKVRQAEHLKARLFEAMQVLKLDKIKTPTATAALQKSPAALELSVPDNEVPDEYTETKRVVRKDMIKAALQDGATFAWAKLTQNVHLRFR